MVMSISSSAFDRIISRKCLTICFRWLKRRAQLPSGILKALTVKVRPTTRFHSTSVKGSTIFLGEQTMRFPRHWTAPLTTAVALSILVKWRLDSAIAPGRMALNKAAVETTLNGGDSGISPIAMRLECGVSEGVRPVPWFKPLLR